MSEDHDVSLIDDLRGSPESECVEFKVNMSNPPDIGKYISAIANVAAMTGEKRGYLIWGIRNSDHAVIGTRFDPAQQVQNQPLVMWLAQRIQPDSAFAFRTVEHPQGHLVLLEIPAAATNPITFDRIAYIRINSSTPPLLDHPDRERVLWRILQGTRWEEGFAVQSVVADKTLALIDYARYFELMKLPFPDNRTGILERLSQDGIIVADAGDRWNVTNLGAILFAKSLDAFGPPLSHKAVRFAVYDGKGRYDQVTHRREEQRGYAVGFNDLVTYINEILPARENIGQVFRTEMPSFPRLAVRELVANALIHQNMTITGAGPTIEVFHDRIEITNSGKPLISSDRFIDAPPQSYNKAISTFMRRMKICEELGTGIDKAVKEIERSQSPPPDFREEGEATRVLLYAPRKFADLTREERIRACYQHTVLRYVSGNRMKNNTLRERFGLAAQQTVKVSQVIRAALDAELIRLANPAHPRAGYVPIWA